MIGDHGLQSRPTPSGRRKLNAATPPNEHEIAIYNSNITVSTVFWDWRHKALTLYLSLITAIGRLSPGSTLKALTSLMSAYRSLLLAASVI